MVSNNSAAFNSSTALHAPADKPLRKLYRSTGMLLMWTFAEVSRRPYWKAMTWGMVSC